MIYDYSETIDYLLDWYDSNARTLVWRDNPTPYFVWISEIMLQQTRVEAVKSYFNRFISVLPDIEALATVDEEKLLKLWEGLGYYNRARNLQKAAKIIMTKYHGQMPVSFEEILTLPGIGSYTAGAISSIAFGLRQPAVDGNVLRVMKRLAASYDDITKASVKKELEQDLREIMPQHRPGDFNQAIMELGATVCIPNGKPLCDKCPIMHLCNGLQQGIHMEIPKKPPKKPRKLEEKTILLIERNNEYALRKRDDQGLLAGMWELPHLEGKLTTSQLDEKLHKEGFRNYTVDSLGEAKHIFSHIEWRMNGYHVRIEATTVNEATNNIYEIEYPNTSKDAFLWASKEEIDSEYSLPTAFKAYRNYMI